MILVYVNDSQPLFVHGTLSFVVRSLDDDPLFLKNSTVSAMIIHIPLYLVIM